MEEQRTGVTGGRRSVYKHGEGGGTRGVKLHSQAQMDWMVKKRKEKLVWDSSRMCLPLKWQLILQFKTSLHN